MNEFMKNKTNPMMEEYKVLSSLIKRHQNGLIEKKISITEPEDWYAFCYVVHALDSRLSKFLKRVISFPETKPLQEYMETLKKIIVSVDKNLEGKYAYEIYEFLPHVVENLSHIFSFKKLEKQKEKISTRTEEYVKTRNTMAKTTDIEDSFGKKFTVLDTYKADFLKLITQQDALYEEYKLAEEFFFSKREEEKNECKKIKIESLESKILEYSLFNILFKK